MSPSVVLASFYGPNDKPHHHHNEATTEKGRDRSVRTRYCVPVRAGACRCVAGACVPVRGGCVLVRTGAWPMRAGACGWVLGARVSTRARLCFTIHCIQ